MDIAHPVSSEITSLSFSYLHTHDIKRVSVKPVVNPVLFDNLNNPNAGGLYDPAFGPLGKGDMCVAVSLSLLAWLGPTEAGAVGEGKRDQTRYFGGTSRRERCGRTVCANTED